MAISRSLFHTIVDNTHWWKAHTHLLIRLKLRPTCGGLVCYAPETSIPEWAISELLRRSLFKVSAWRWL